MNRNTIALLWAAATSLGVATASEEPIKVVTELTPWASNGAAFRTCRFNPPRITYTVALLPFSSLPSPGENCGHDEPGSGDSNKLDD